MTTTTTACPYAPVAKGFTGSRWEYSVSWTRAVFRRIGDHVVASDGASFDGEAFLRLSDAVEFFGRLCEGHAGDLVVRYEDGIYTYEDGELVDEDVMHLFTRTLLDSDGRTVELDGDAWAVDFFDRAVREGVCR